MFSTINDNFVKDFLDNGLNIYSSTIEKQTPTMTNSSFEATTLEDGKQQITINTLGHNPKDITVDVTEGTVSVKSTKEDGTSRFVKDIDLFLKLDKNYDGTKSTASFNSGLLTIVVDQKLNTKSKSIKISY
jgi:HSP20 family molecular chaperone IbpA